MPPLRFCPAIGSLRRRVPVAANMALQSAGATRATDGSPIPPGAASLLKRWTSTVGHFVAAQDPVGVEIRLLHAASGDGDIAPQRRGEPEDDAAHDLRLDDARIDHLAAIHRAGELVHLERTRVDGNLGDQRQVGGVALHERHALISARGRMTPVRTPGGLGEHARVPRLRLEQREPKIHGILAGGVRQFVHEAFDHEAVRRMAHRAHVADVDADFLPQISQAEVRDGVGIIGGILHHRIERIGARGRVARRDRRAGDVQSPGRQPALAVEAAADLFAHRRLELIMGHVVFARPDELDRSAHRLRCRHRGRDEIHFQAPAEAAAQQRGEHAHLGGFQPGGLGGRRLSHLLHLRPHEEIASIRLHVRRAIHRLHGGMRLQGPLVHRAHAPLRRRERRRGIALGARAQAGAAPPPSAAARVSGHCRAMHWRRNPR